MLIRDKFRLNKDNTILLIIDMQDRLAPAMEYREESIKNTNILIQMANTYNIPVIATEQYPKGLGSTLEVISENFNDKVKIFPKMSFSAYDEIKDYIKETGRNQIVMTGMETHVCVYQTARDLLDNDYNVYIAKDAVDSRFKTNFKNGLQLMESMGASITNTETILFDMMELAGTDQFKKLSKLIK